MLLYSLARALRATFMTAGILTLWIPAALPAGAAEPKWAPYGVLLGRGGSGGGLGGADLFAPLWQNPSALFFTDLRGTMDDDAEIQGNFGLGYRRMINEHCLGGIYAYFDILETEEDNTFLQGTTGVELLTERWDFRVNGYIPESDQERVPGDAVATLMYTPTGQAVGIRESVERALYGVDWEAGWRLPILVDGENSEVRLFAGGYYRDAGGVSALVGPTGRLEVRLFDLPFLPTGSRFTLGGEVSWDDPRGTRGAAMARIRIPLNFFGGGEERLQGLDRRMVDRVVRGDAVVRRRKGPAELVGNLAYTDGLTEGDARSVPTAGEIETAIGVAGPGGIIVALDQTGPIDPLNDNQTIDLLPGQVLMGGGSSVMLTTGGASALFTAPGGRGMFQTGDEIIHMQVAEGGQVHSVDIDGGLTGLQVVGDRAIVRDVAITNIASTTPVIAFTTGVNWLGNDGLMEEVSIGDVSSVDDVDTAGVMWHGDRGTMRNVTIGNITSVDTSVASALNWSGDGGFASDVTMGNVSSVNGEVRGIWWSTEGSTLENVVLGNVTSTNSLARGLDWVQALNGAGTVRNVTIGEVRGGYFADGVHWWAGDGSLRDVMVGNVTADDGSANGLYRESGIGGTVSNLTVGNVTGSAMGGAGSAAGIRWSYSDDGILTGATIGNVTAFTSGWGLGVIADNSDNVELRDITVGNVAAVGDGNHASGIRFRDMTNSSASEVTVGNVGLLGEGQPFFGGARGIDLSGTDLALRDITIGHVTNVDNTRAFARGIFFQGIGESSVRGVEIGNVTATAPDATAIGVDFLQNGGIVEDVQMGVVTGDSVAKTFAIRFNNVSDSVANQIRFVQVNGNGVLFEGAATLNNVGTGNNGTLFGLGVQNCIDLAGDSTGSAVEFNTTTCP